MKKTFSAILASATLLSASITSANTEKNAYTLYIDDVFTDTQVITYENKQMLPLKEICGYLGYILNEEADGRVIITEGENCKHNGPVKIEFTVGDYFITHTSKLDYTDKTEAFPKEPITVKIGNEIYIHPYYFSRVFGTKNVYTGDDKKIGIETWEYKDEKNKYGIPSNGTIFVKSFSDTELKIELDGKKLEFTSKPFIDNMGRTQVPVREFCEQLNYSVDWFENPDRVAISSVPPNLNKTDDGGAGGASFWFTIGENEYRRNGTYYSMDTAAQIIEGKTYIPLRYLAQAARYNIAFNPTSHTKRFIGFAYRTLHSYLGRNKSFILGELKLDDTNIASSSDTHFDYVANHITEPFSQTSVNLSFDHDILSGFAYIYRDYESAFVTVCRFREYFNNLYGNAVTDKNEVCKTSDLTETEPTDEFYSYYDDWKADEINPDAYALLFGNEDMKATHTLRLNKTPEGYWVFVQYYPIDRQA